MIGDKWKRIGNFVIRRNSKNNIFEEYVYIRVLERLYFG